MQTKVAILTAHLFVRNKHDDRPLDDFLTFARKYMARQSDVFRQKCVEHSVLFCNADSIARMLQAGGESVGLIRQSLEEMLATN